MPIYWDSYFGIEAAKGASQGNAILKITDGDLEVSWLVDPGFDLLFDGWNGQAAAFKPPTYGNSALADGQVLKHAVFDNVIENFRFALHFGSTNDMLRRLNELEELLKNRAPRYWMDRFYNNPVWIERSLDGESQSSYALISQGSIVKPPTFFDNRTIVNQVLQPVLVQVNRQPFWLGAKPGQTQKQVTVSATQTWNYARTWQEETTLPSGQIFSMVELANGDIYAGGASEILYYNGTTWSTATTTPITLAEDVTAATLLDNGDILFGGNGRIIKLSGGTWSEETTLPTGQVYAILEANDGRIYAADNGRIIAKDETGTWAEDDDLPSGQAYSLLQSSTGALFAGEAGRILRSLSDTPTEIKVQINSDTDDAEERSGTMDLDSNDLDLFEDTDWWVGLRFNNLTIPQGAKINSAKIRFTAQESDTGTAGTVVIYCEDVDSATTFTSAANNISGRTRTTASSTWEAPPSFVKDETYDTADLSQPLQEVVNRSGWSSGNAVAFLIETTVEGRDRDALTHDKAPDEAAELIVEYTQQLASGARWEINSNLPGGDVRSLIECDGVILAGENGQILGSEDDGETWGVVSTLPTGEVRTIVSCDCPILYAGDNGQVLKSSDGGNNWSVDSTTPTAYVNAILCAASGVNYAGDNGRILSLAAATFTMGQADTTGNQVMVANHHKEANLTNVVIDDAGFFTEIFPATSFPFTLYPATATVNDAMYFGIDTSLDDTGPFTSLVFDIETPASAATSYTIVWEYYNGAWTALTVQDGTSQFSQVGVNVVAWEQPSDMTTPTVNGTTGHFIRARLSALTGAFTNPTQANRDIYAPSLAFAELDESQARGVIDSLGKIQIANRSDNGGPGGANPQLYANRILIGAKPVADHESFRAFLNFADEQNPDGVSVDVSVDGDSATSFVDSSGAAVGRAVFFDGGLATLDSLADRVKIALNTTVARDYYGAYKVFVRGRQSGGAAGQISLKVKVVSGTGGISATTGIKTTASTSDHELIEFEEPLRLPVSSLFTSDELGDETSITLQVSTSSASADFYAYDIFLLPTNLMWVDSKDTANNTSSAISNGARLTIDSISVPKILIKSVAEKVATGLFKAGYRPDSNGEMRLLNNRQHRLWMLAAQTESAGSTVWISKPEVVHSVRCWVTDRWITGRGLI